MIAFVQTNFDELTGQSKSALDVLVALRQADEEIFILSTNQPQLNFEHDTYQVVISGWRRFLRFRHLHPKHGIKKIKAALTSLAAFVWNAWQILRLRLSKTSFPQIIVNGVASHSLYSSRLKSKHSRAFIIFREMPEYVRRKADDFNKLCRQLNEYDQFVFVSEKNAAAWSEHLDTRGRSRVIYNAIIESDVIKLVNSEKRDVRRSLGVDDDSFLISCVGTVHENKGQEFLIACLPELRKAIPNLRIMFAGKCDVKYRGRLESALAADDCAGMVEFLGPRQDAMTLIYAADLLVCASRSEAFPRVVLEAMALTTPVVATRVGGIPEMIIDDETGLLVPPENPQALTAAILKMNGSQQLRERLADNARERYVDNFSRQRQIREIKTCLHPK
jgi:glycosyltransferase involved in cell wall biosynthesis